MLWKKTLAILLAFSAIPVVAEAQAASRYDPTRSACLAVQAAIGNEGAVILRWDDANGIPRFDRFVADSSFCDPNEQATTTYVPTRDGECAVAVCRPVSSDCDGNVQIIVSFYRKPDNLRPVGLSGPCGEVIPF